MAGSDEPLSPELALVDPEAAERARLALPERVLTENLIRAGEPAGAPPPLRDEPLQPRPAAAREPSFRPLERTIRDEPPARRRGRRRWLTAAGLGAVAIAAGAVLATPRISDIVRSKAAETVKPDETPQPSRSIPPATAATTTASVPKATTPAGAAQPPATSTRRIRAPSTPPIANPTTGRPSIPDFVWVRDQRAHGYRIEFRAGSKVVLRVRTQTTRLRVPPARLPPGRYRWVVWRLNGHGDPVGAPLVDAILTIR